jgi:hypothetical protein
MRSPRFLAAALLVGLLAVPAARAGDATGAFAPYEDVTEVLGDLTWHLKDDLYRFPPPRDPTGHDLFRLTLERLHSWEQRFPGRLHDVITFARAETLERLQEYGQAADAYRQVAGSPSPLAESARTGAERAAAFAAAAGLPEDGADVGARLTALRTKLDAWGKLIERHAGTPFEAIAQVEEERLERIAADVVVQNRRVIDDGNATAERSLRFVLQKHTDSKNLPDHIMRLADFYATVAREYAESHEKPLSFDEKEFTTEADRALETYRKVATWDGVREKPEGQGRFSAFEAYKTAVLARYH